MTTRAWSTGPVALTGGNGHVGRAVRRRLAELPNPIRSLGRDDDWTPEIRQANAVIHLAGTLQPRRPATYQEANVGTFRGDLQAHPRSRTQDTIRGRPSGVSGALGCWDPA